MPHVVPGLVEHVGSPCLHLSLALPVHVTASGIKHQTCGFCEPAPRLQDSKPELLSLHRFPTDAFGFQPGVQLFKVLAPEIHQSLARVVVIGFVGAEESPILILLDD